MMQKGANDWKVNQLTVALRVRPLFKDEKDTGASNIAQIVDDQVVVLMDPAEDPMDVLRAHRSREKHFCFDHVFGPQCPQDEVYSKTAKALINSVTMGFNATVFAYGATGAGKTYTMLGTDQEPGIMARALNDLFQEMDRNSEHSVYKATMSYLEIYNEMIRDLLNPSSGYLDLREHSSGTVQVAGISEVSTTSSTEVMNLLIRGNKERTQEPTAANKTSSRSHAVLQVTVHQRDRIRGINQNVRTGKLFMIDLAGSERAAHTKNRGKRMIEGAHINRSLLALGNCINALCDGAGKYVNYRDSKLTRLLKDSLGGNCKTVMIANISPSSYFFEESRNTLNYADRAKRIKMKIKSNATSVKNHMAQYTNIISELKQEIKRLQEKISSHEEEERETAVEDAESHKKMDVLRQQLMSNFNTQMGIRQELMDVEQMTWRLSMEANKQLAVIAEWEQEQLRLQSKNKPKINLAFKDLGNRLKEKDKERDIDTKSTTSESPEPEDISRARQQLSIILRQRADCYSKKSDLEESLNNVRNKGSVLEENLPNKTTSNEQREILSMLCKVHELEIENTELKSRALYNSHQAEMKESDYAKLEEQRKLCNEIILQQKALLEEHHILYTQELEELHEMFEIMVRDSTPGWNTGLGLPHIQTSKGSLISMTSTHPAPEQETGYKKIDEMRKSFREPSTAEKAHRTENSDRVFNPSPRSWKVQELMDDVPFLLPQVLVQSPGLTRHGSFTSLGERRPSNPKSPTSISLHERLSPQPERRREKQIEMRNQTKNITAKAARRKTSNYDRRLVLEKTPTSLHSFKEEAGESYLSPSRLSCDTRSTSKNAQVTSGNAQATSQLLREKSPTSLHSLQELSETGENSLSPSRLSGHSRSTERNLKSTDRNSKSASRLSELDDVGGSISSLERKNEGGADKRVNYRGGVKKIHMTNRQVMQKKMRRKGMNDQMSTSQRKHSQMTRTSAGEGKLSNKKPKPVVVNGVFIKQTSLKYPVNHNTGGEHCLVKMDSNLSPGMTIRQVGTEKGKGHTVQRRLRGPAASNSSVNGPLGSQRFSGHKASGIPSRTQPGSLQISGQTVPRRNSVGGRRF